MSGGDPPPFSRHIRIDPQDKTALQRPFQVRWEAAFPDRLVTCVWDNQTGDDAIMLEHVPNFGRFHRLVVRTPQLEFGAGAVLRGGAVVVRLVNGVVFGDKMEPFTQGKISENHITIEGGPHREYQEQGRFIEIVVPGDTAEQAELRAYTTLGLLAAVLGDHAVGEVLFSAAHYNDRAQDGVVISETYGLIPWAVSEQALDMVEYGLSQLGRGDEEMEALALALRWYEHGTRAHAVLDQFLSYFVGIEGAVKALTKGITPPRVHERQQRYRALKKRLGKELDPATLEDLSRAIQRPPDLRERFGLYRERRQWPAELDNLFADLLSRRNDVFHGSSTAVSERQALEAKQLLGRIMRVELDLPDALDWERLPIRFPVRTEGRTLISNTQSV